MFSSVSNSAAARVELTRLVIQHGEEAGDRPSGA
jgi:hypothetical protein